MDQFSLNNLQGAQRKYIRLFVETNQKKFLATVDAFSQNLSDQIANSYACTFNQSQTEPNTTKFQVTNIRQNGFVVIIPKGMNIGQVLDDNSQITCNICKAKNKNKKTKNNQINEKKIKKNVKEEQKLEFHNFIVSPPKISTTNDLLLELKKEEKHQQNQKQQTKKNQVYNQSQQEIDGLQNNTSQNKILKDKISQQKDSIQILNNQIQSSKQIDQIDKIENNQKEEILFNNKVSNLKTPSVHKGLSEYENQNLNISIIENNQDKANKDQQLGFETNQQQQNQKEKFQTNNIIENKNLLLKEGLDYLLDVLNCSKELPKVPNTSFSKNIEHTRRQKNQKSNKKHPNQQKQYNNNVQINKQHQRNKSYSYSNQYQKNKEQNQGFSNRSIQSNKNKNRNQNQNQNNKE